MGRGLLCKVLVTENGNGYRVVWGHREMNRRGDNPSWKCFCEMVKKPVTGLLLLGLEVEIFGF